MKCSSQECRHAALAAAAKLLLNVRERCKERPTDVESSPWVEALSELWELAMSLRAKPKHALPALRLLSALVSALPAEEVDVKAAGLLKGHVLPALAPAKSGGVMNKMLSAAGIGSAKGTEDPRLVALQAVLVNSLLSTSLRARTHMHACVHARACIAGASGRATAPRSFTVHPIPVLPLRPLCRRSRSF